MVLNCVEEVKKPYNKVVYLWSEGQVEDERGGLLLLVMLH